MNTELIFSNITKHIELTREEQDHICEVLGEQSVKKSQFILRQGDTCNHISFVNTGILRAYFLSESGKESTVMFAAEDWWITDMYCFLNRAPAMVSIQAVENSSVLQLSKKNLDTLFEEIPSFNKFFRILMQNAYCREQLRMIQNLSQPAMERYENFLNTYPQIARNVPLKQIASYLGITPEFLSALRSNKN